MIPDSIDFISMQSDENNMPKIVISGDCLFASNFLPNQMLIAEVYEGKIIIRPLEDIQKFKMLVKI